MYFDSKKPLCKSICSYCCCCCPKNCCKKKLKKKTYYILPIDLGMNAAYQYYHIDWMNLFEEIAGIKEIEKSVLGEGIEDTSSKRRGKAMIGAGKLDDEINRLEEEEMNKIAKAEEEEAKKKRKTHHMPQMQHWHHNKKEGEHEKDDLDTGDSSKSSSDDVSKKSGSRSSGSDDNEVKKKIKAISSKMEDVLSSVASSSKESMVSDETMMLENSKVSTTVVGAPLNVEDTTVSTVRQRRETSSSSSGKAGGGANLFYGESSSSVASSEDVNKVFGADSKSAEAKDVVSDSDLAMLSDSLPIESQEELLIKKTPENDDNDNDTARRESSKESINDESKRAIRRNRVETAQNTNLKAKLADIATSLGELGKALAASEPQSSSKETSSRLRGTNEFETDDNVVNDPTDTDSYTSSGPDSDEFPEIFQTNLPLSSRVVEEDFYEEPHHNWRKARKDRLKRERRDERERLRNYKRRIKYEEKLEIRARAREIRRLETKRLRKMHSSKSEKSKISEKSVNNETVVSKDTVTEEATATTTQDDFDTVEERQVQEILMQEYSHQTSAPSSSKISDPNSYPSSPISSSISEPSSPDYTSRDEALFSSDSDFSEDSVSQQSYISNESLAELEDHIEQLASIPGPETGFQAGSRLSHKSVDDIMRDCGVLRSDGPGVEISEMYGSEGRFGRPTSNKESTSNRDRFVKPSRGDIDIDPSPSSIADQIDDEITYMFNDDTEIDYENDWEYEVKQIIRGKGRKVTGVEKSMRYDSVTEGRHKVPAEEDYEELSSDDSYSDTNPSEDDKEDNRRPLKPMAIQDTNEDLLQSPVDIEPPDLENLPTSSAIVLPSPIVPRTSKVSDEPVMCVPVGVPISGSYSSGGSSSPSSTPSSSSGFSSTSSSDSDSVSSDSESDPYNDLEEHSSSSMNPRDRIKHTHSLRKPKKKNVKLKRIEEDESLKPSPIDNVDLDDIHIREAQPTYARKSKKSLTIYSRSQSSVSGGRSTQYTRSSRTQTSPSWPSATADTSRGEAIPLSDSRSGSRSGSDYSRGSGSRSGSRGDSDRGSGSRSHDSRSASGSYTHSSQMSNSYTHSSQMSGSYIKFSSQHSSEFSGISDKSWDSRFGSYSRRNRGSYRSSQASASIRRSEESRISGSGSSLGGRYVRDGRTPLEPREPIVSSRQKVTNRGKFEDSHAPPDVKHAQDMHDHELDAYHHKDASKLPHQQTRMIQRRGSKMFESARDRPRASIIHHDDYGTPEAHYTSEHVEQFDRCLGFTYRFVPKHGALQLLRTDKSSILAPLDIPPLSMLVEINGVKQEHETAEEALFALFMAVTYYDKFAGDLPKKMKHAFLLGSERGVSHEPGLDYHQVQRLKEQGGLKHQIDHDRSKTTGKKYDPNEYGTEFVWNAEEYAKILRALNANTAAIGSRYANAERQAAEQVMKSESILKKVREEAAKKVDQSYGAGELDKRVQDRDRESRSSDRSEREKLLRRLKRDQQRPAASSSGGSGSRSRSSRRSSGSSSVKLGRGIGGRRHSKVQDGQHFSSNNMDYIDDEQLSVIPEGGEDDSHSISKQESKHSKQEEGESEPDIPSTILKEGKHEAEKGETPLDSEEGKELIEDKEGLHFAPGDDGPRSALAGKGTKGKGKKGLSIAKKATSRPSSPTRKLPTSGEGALIKFGDSDSDEMPDFVGKLNTHQGVAIDRSRERMVTKLKGRKKLGDKYIEDTEEKTKGKHKHKHKKDKLKEKKEGKGPPSPNQSSHPKSIMAPQQPTFEDDLPNSDEEDVYGERSDHFAKGGRNIHIRHDNLHQDHPGVKTESHERAQERKWQEQRKRERQASK